MKMQENGKNWNCYNQQNWGLQKGRSGSRENFLALVMGESPNDTNENESGEDFGKVPLYVWQKRK